MATQAHEAALYRQATARTLLRLRQERDIPQTVVAESVGITQASVSNYEKGKRDVPMTTFVRMAWALGETVQSLWTAVLAEVEVLSTEERRAS